MTERIYDRDSHQKTFQAAVLRCEAVGEGWRVALDRTCFFPEGGGQFGDRGTLTPAGGAPIPVTDTQEEGDLVWHNVTAPIPAGTEVTGELDWALRFARMQCHSGEHIVSGLFHARDGVDNVGFHLGDEEVILDLSGPVSWEEVQEVERLANEAVSMDLPVSCEYPPEEELKTLTYRSKLDLTEHVRIVTIPGYDVCACCAPHVNRTGEIGLIHFLSSQNWKGGVRLRMLCGSRAVADVMAKQNSVAAISARLSAHQSQVAQAVERQSGELEAVKQENARLGKLAAQALAETLPAGEEALCFAELPTPALRALVNAAVEKGVPLCAAFAPEGERFAYILGAGEGLDLRPLVKEMNAALSGRGGGSAAMVQGSVAASRQDIEAWWAARKTVNKS
ncbi:hypothetical protein B5G43_14725 [Flavonifractor sp. An92]|uniref:alanyl-tRNA editing protein n=1 Tax=Flavonifractor sp. An92 TaxID=1965666 RepID=UPI000B3A0A09|nr:alanyl-tRNA editing protein [Flavonifractor sp. An92]OUN04159.1 hypothetical protein B5G43_14725 [Flavonifractor sp. An92]